MMVLLQWPSCSMSPSRNQTPGAICFTVFGCASERVRTKLSESRTRKVDTNHRRVCFIACDSIESRRDCVAQASACRVGTHADARSFMPNSLACELQVRFDEVQRRHECRRSKLKLAPPLR